MYVFPFLSKYLLNEISIARWSQWDFHLWKWEKWAFPLLSTKVPQIKSLLRMTPRTLNPTRATFSRRGQLTGRRSQREFFQKSQRDFSQEYQRGFSQRRIWKRQSFLKPTGCKTMLVLLQGGFCHKSWCETDHNVKQIMMRNDSEEWGSPMMKKLDVGWRMIQFLIWTIEYGQDHDNAQWQWRWWWHGRWCIGRKLIQFQQQPLGPSTSSP